MRQCRRGFSGAVQWSTAQAKIEAMEKAGITVVRNLGELGKTAVEIFGK